MNTTQGIRPASIRRKDVDMRVTHLSQQDRAYRRWSVLFALCLGVQQITCYVKPAGDETGGYDNSDPCDYCASGEVCIDDACVDCDSELDRDCDDNRVYEEDLCGNRELVEECGSDSECRRGSCIECDSDFDEVCDDDDAYLRDACGNLQLADDCRSDETCEDGECIDCDSEVTRTCCFSDDSAACTEDLCGNFEILEYCADDETCNEGYCEPNESQTEYECTRSSDCGSIEFCHLTDSYGGYCDIRSESGRDCYPSDVPSDEDHGGCLTDLQCMYMEGCGYLCSLPCDSHSDCPDHGVFISCDESGGTGLCTYYDGWYESACE